MGEWLESHTRIPFVGIIAMVIIVAIVAIFIKTQIGPLFPASDVKVETENGNVAGHASASFYGVREIQLKRTEYLQGVLNRNEHSLLLVVDPASKLLVIIEGSRREEIILHEDGDMFTATFEYNGVQTNVRVSVDNYLLYTEPGKSAIQMRVPLSDGVRYQGYFTVRNRQYLLQFMPTQHSAAVIGSITNQIDLSLKNGIYAGVWDEAGKKHPITIDLSKMIATVEEVY
jgi:hypothetical protein